MTSKQTDAAPADAAAVANGQTAVLPLPPASKPAPKHGGGHGHGHGHAGGPESPLVKFLISGTVAFTFELMIGHYLEFLKISKQTSELSYVQLTRNMVKHKGILGVLDGYFPWGAIQCFVKGASFGFGQSLGYNLLDGTLPEFQREVASGGIGGLFQGIVMSPLLLLKTRVMTMPEMRNSGGILATTLASTRIGAQVVRNEGVGALMKGSILFSTKRMADWTTRFFFAEVVADSIRKHNASKGILRPLDFYESSGASLAGGALSATATIPMDVLVATFQSSAKAGQKVSVMSVWAEKMKSGGITGLVAYSSKGYVARVAHVAATTLLMKSVSTAVYDLYNTIAKR